MVHKVSTEYLFSSFEECMSRVLICTGFHRSATSATANYLSNAGLNMGRELIGGSISNQQGHFEDVDVVRLHDEQLVENNTTWQFHDEVLLDSDSTFLDEYVDIRTKESNVWGLKDPRACLFLPQWDRALEGNGHFLFLIRHWSSCVESLLNRHSREIAFNLPNFTKNPSDINFWAQPDLAARMWLSYNQRLLSFIKKNPKCTITITQRALMEGAPIIEEINNKFGFNLDINTKAPFDPDLINEIANINISRHLSVSLRNQLNDTWEQLLSLSDFSSNNEEVLTYESDDISCFKPIFNPSDETDFRPNKMCKTLESQDWLKTCLMHVEPIEFQRFLSDSDIENVFFHPLSSWLPEISRRYSIDASTNLSIAKLLLKIERPDLAINYFHLTTSLGLYYPYIDMLIAQCHQMLGCFEESEFYLNKAIAANPNNPAFYIHLGKLYDENQDDEKAIFYLYKGYEIDRSYLFGIVSLCDFLQKKGRHNEVVSLAEDWLCSYQSDELRQALIRSLYQVDLIRGKEYYLSYIKDKLSRSNVKLFLSNLCLNVYSFESEKDIVYRCFRHWNKIGIEI